MWRVYRFMQAFLSNEGLTLEMLDFAFYIGSTPTLYSQLTTKRDLHGKNIGLLYSSKVVLSIYTSCNSRKRDFSFWGGGQNQFVAGGGERLKGGTVGAPRLYVKKGPDTSYLNNTMF